MVDALFSLFDRVDGWASFLPLAVRVACWGAVAGTAATAIYALIADRRAIHGLKAEIAASRRAILGAPLDQAVPMALYVRNLKHSLALMGKVAVPSLISLPAVALVAAWLNAHHGYAAVADRATLPVTAIPAPTPAMGSLAIRASDGGTGRIAVFLGPVQIYEGDPCSPPTPVVEKRTWRHALLPSEVGYLADTAPVEALNIGLPAKRILPALPDWAAGWEATFLFAGLLAALAGRTLFGIR